MQVWERLIVTIDAVLLVDEADGVQGRWAQPVPPALRLYDALVLVGVPLTADRHRAWSFGRPDWVELRVAVSNDQVLAVTGAGATVPLPTAVTDLVLDFYCRHIDDVGS